MPAINKAHLILLLWLASVPACSPTSMILNKVGKSFENAGIAFQSENDPELVREALPFTLKTLDMMLASNPENTNLLESALIAYIMYAYAFIKEDADRMLINDYQAGQKLYSRARNLFERARAYGLKALEIRHPGFSKWLLNPEDAPQNFTRDDVSLLYWTGGAYAGTIACSSGNPAYLVDMPKIGRLFETALIIDPEWNQGAIYSALISYTVKRPDAGKDAEMKARNYFAKAVQASAGKDCSPYLALAESISIRNQNKEEFQTMLALALAIDVNQNLEIRLANVLAQDRARWLLERIDELFY